MDKLYTIQEVATKLDLSDKTLRRWEDAGRFSSSRTLGNQRRYSIEDIQILDAIKHGTINEQKDLLTVDQASKLCGVSPTTILRWENDGKIHPFITSGNTYYIRQRLIEKMDELKKIYVEPEPTSPPSVPVGAHHDAPATTAPPKLTPFTPREPLQSPPSVPYTPYFMQALITIILILSYHFIFNSPSKPISPQSGSVQGVSISTDPTIDLLRTILDPSGAITTTTLTSRVSLVSPILSLAPSSAPTAPTPGTIYYDATTQSLKVWRGTDWFDLAPSTKLKIGDVTLVTSSSVLAKGQSQASFTDDAITPTTPVTVTFTSDYAPAKKYWVTTAQGSFTLHTDFPVGTDTNFNYSFLVPSNTF